MALEQYFDTDPDFFLEELQTDRHLYDYHRIWSDAASLIWSTQSPKQSVAETREWLQRWTKEADAGIFNYAIMLRVSSALNPTNPASSYGPVVAVDREYTSIGRPSKDNSDSHAGGAARPFLIGQVGILRPAVYADTSASSSSPEIGYMIHHTHWGLGLASRALRVFLAGYWTVLNPPRVPADTLLDVIEAHIDPANLASQHMAAKVGFVPGEEAGEEFRLAATKELRKLRVWRLQRPVLPSASG